MKKWFTTLALGLAVSASAQAQNWPAKPVTMLVPFPPGGSTDLIARTVAPKLQDKFGGTFVIENKPGAGGTLGAGQAKRAAPDGYTVLVSSLGPFVIGPHLVKEPGYNALKDFEYITVAVQAPNVLVVNANSQLRDMKGVLDYLKSNPGRMTFASAGNGTSDHLTAELFWQETGTQATHVPYKGGAPAIVDVMGGQVDVYFANAASSLNYVTGGKLKALAVSSSQRMPELPNVATVGEAGIKNFNVVEWNGFFLPAGASPEVVAKLQDLVQKALARPDTREKLAKLGLSPVGSSAEDFAKFVDAEQTRWAEVVKTNNIQVN